MNDHTYTGPSSSEHSLVRALILVDIQNDFLPGGALAVAQGDHILPPVNRLLAERTRLFSYVVATQDWHPAGHESFASQHQGVAVGQLSELHGLPQVMWPDHCVQETYGARFSDDLNTRAFDHVVAKGTDPVVDSYSGFFDNDRRGDTKLHTWLSERGITELVIAGLATDYCVKFTVLDALSLGYKVTVVVDAVKGVNLKPNDSEQALSEMTKAGAKLARTRDILGGCL